MYRFLSDKIWVNPRGYDTRVHDDDSSDESPYNAVDLSAYIEYVSGHLKLKWWFVLTLINFVEHCLR